MSVRLVLEAISAFGLTYWKSHTQFVLSAARQDLRLRKGGFMDVDTMNGLIYFSSLKLGNSSLLEATTEKIVAAGGSIEVDPVLVDD
jgi:hypothetical protein